jgi:predicted AAA+ superfamily ATPase
VPSRHGQVWNASEFARSFGVADTTVRGYLDRLTSALVVRQLAPWHENIAKRQVRSPKIYVSDSGLLHTLLNLRTTADLEAHPKVGASWEVCAPPTLALVHFTFWTLGGNQAPSRMAFSGQ